MNAPNRKLADSMEQLRSVLGDRRVLRSGELSRTHRDRLARSGFLRRAAKGWLYVSNPAEAPDDATGWYGCFWEFCAVWCNHRFGDAWHLSAEASLATHAQIDAVPSQVVVCSPRAANHVLDLPFGTSVLDLKTKAEPADGDVSISSDGLRVLEPAAALVAATPHTFKTQRVAVTAVLVDMSDHSGLLGRLLDGGHTTVAGRLAGAFRVIGREDVADDVMRAMKSAGFDVREECPWAGTAQATARPRPDHPAATRVRLMWEGFRDEVGSIMPPAPGRPIDPVQYLADIDDQYPQDAYHSLSIEGYRVSPGLIERVRSGAWNPDTDPDGTAATDAMAARGYWQAFQQVRADAARIVSGADAPELVRERHQEWYRELFGPSVDIGLAEPSDLIGYRRHPVYLSQSRYVPMRPEAVPSAMGELFDLLAAEDAPGVRAVLGHFFFGYIHPYLDGNGRMARFVMNAMLAADRYRWTTIRVQDRDRYMNALDTASLHQRIGPFAELIADRVDQTPQHTR